MIDYDAIPVWFNEYVEIPFVDGGRDESGCDCYGLIRLVLKDRFNIDVPLYGELYEDTGQREKVSEGVLSEASQHYWRQIHAIQGKPGDVAVFKIAGLPVHVGLLLAPDVMMNIYKGSHVKLDSITGILWGKRLHGLYRHTSRI